LPFCEGALPPASAAVTLDLLRTAPHPCHLQPNAAATAPLGAACESAHLVGGVNLRGELSALLRLWRPVFTIVALHTALHAALYVFTISSPTNAGLLRARQRDPRFSAAQLRNWRNEQHACDYN
jgi:hypothetical protein